MFISKVEKDMLFTRVEQLEARLSMLQNTVKNMTFAAEFVPIKPDKRKGRTWTPEQRAAQAELIRQRWAKKKETKNG